MPLVARWRADNTNAWGPASEEGAFQGAARGLHGGLRGGHVGMHICKLKRALHCV